MKPWMVPFLAVAMFFVIVSAYYGGRALGQTYPESSKPAPIVVEREPAQSYTPAPESPIQIGKACDDEPDNPRCIRCDVNDNQIRVGGLLYCFPVGTFVNLNLDEEITCRVKLPRAPTPRRKQKL